MKTINREITAMKRFINTEPIGIKTACVISWCDILEPDSEASSRGEYSEFGVAKKVIYCNSFKDIVKTLSMELFVMGSYEPILNVFYGVEPYIDDNTGRHWFKRITLNFEFYDETPKGLKDRYMCAIAYLCKKAGIQWKYI